MQLSYRFLSEDDIPVYVELFDKLPSMMKAKKLNEFRTALVKHFNHPRKKSVGAFNADGELVGALSGQYPDKIPYWYLHNKFFLTSNDTLASHLQYIVMFNELSKPLIAHAEAMQYYSFYSRMSKQHHDSFTKLVKVAQEKNMIEDQRYSIYYEWEYKPNDKCPFITHQFYFTDDVPMTTNSLVGLHCLKQEYRVKLMNSMEEIENVSDN